MVEFILLAAALGLIPAIVANKKGRNPIGWWLFGFALAIVAIPAVFLVDDLTKKKCPDCRELVSRDAKKCRHCGRSFLGSRVEDF
jgi:hypothetical protein